MTAHDDMEKTWGGAATYAEHHIHDHIHYIRDGQTRAGTIIWICAPIEQDGQLQFVRYVVRPDGRATDTDIVYPAALLIEEPQLEEPQKSQNDESHEKKALNLPQALIERLATLTIPIILKEEIDDNGNPFYVWHIGPSTPQYPFGLYVGTSSHLLDALELALERLIKHVARG